MSWNEWRRRIAVAMMAAVAAWPAMGQERPDTSLMHYKGQDRAARIEAAAKREGTLTLYTSLAEKNIRALVDPFEKKHGIKVVVWRSGQSRVLQRILTEASAGRHEVDAIHMGSPELEALQRERILQPVDSPVFQQLSEGSVPEHREWAATILQVFVQAYNTDKIKKEELPRSYQDLLDPKWQGKLGIEAKAWPWYAALVRRLGEKKGVKLFDDLVDRNGISVRHGTSLLNNMVVAGEVPLALTVYSHMPQASKDRGAAIDWFALDPTIARANGVAIARHAKHPNAALLFYEYMLSADGAQKEFAAMDYVPTNAQLDSPLPDVKFALVDPETVLEEVDKWTRLFDETFVKRAD
ncbi:ABC transporter substrate-binding protein [Pusillimonas sp.]|uniref:ABC transporter substrate-binding protein n=1 Tax=Pusillimonas sp. TaxID=3040095 RepID=UPI00299FF3CF|nr:extracellular solute-binding protein [Pusillimonas sp.]MDX3894539.1 extracellular solute-binding protein [Pusillimonas sp.]